MLLTGAVERNDQRVGSKFITSETFVAAVVVVCHVVYVQYWLVLH